MMLSIIFIYFCLFVADLTKVLENNCCYFPCDFIFLNIVVVPIILTFPILMYIWSFAVPLLGGWILYVGLGISHVALGVHSPSFVHTR